MTARLNLAQFDAAVKNQNAMVFQNAAHTQYGVAIPCPECGKTTQWVEGQARNLDPNVYRMQPCGHEVPSDARQIVVDDNGYLRAQESPSPEAAPNESERAVQLIAATLRTAAEQIQGDTDRITLREIAGTVESNWGGDCCPLCQEVTCDDGCPLQDVRAAQ